MYFRHKRSPFGGCHIDIYWGWKWDFSQGKPSNLASNIYLFNIRTLPFVSQYVTPYQGSPSIHSITLSMEWSECFEWLWDQAVRCGQDESSRMETEGGSTSYLQLKGVARWFPHYVQQWPGVIVLSNYKCVCPFKLF